MILTVIPRHLLPQALNGFASALTSTPARRIFRTIAVPPRARRARFRDAATHHAVALRFARSFGMGIRPGPPKAGLSWDGRALRTGTEAYVLLHEVAHFQLAAPQRRRRADFGLGPGPETGATAVARRQQTVRGLLREREEAMASLLGVLWEVALGQPALASFLDQNWLEGAAPARHFEQTLARLARGGFITATGRPTRRLRRAGNAADA